MERSGQLLNLAGTVLLRPGEVGEALATVSAASGLTWAVPMQLAVLSCWASFLRACCKLLLKRPVLIAAMSSWWQAS